MPRPPLVCVLGATGTGKTGAAISLARALDGTIINFDSRQIYRDLPLVTAQPSREERAQAPHELYGFAAPREQFSAGEYAARLEQCARQAATLGRTPILTGGTGLYLRAFLSGLAPIPPVPENVRAQIAADRAALGTPALHARLAKDDPAYAAKISPNDRQRVTRALEVLSATGVPFSKWHEHPAPPPAAGFTPVKIGLTLPLDELTPRLEQRILDMLAAGAEAEMRAALDFCPDRSAPAYLSIGCPELFAWLEGKMTREEALAAWLANTRAYAKRQITWFKKEPDTAWFEPGEHEKMLKYVREKIAALSKEEEQRR